MSVAVVGSRGLLVHDLGTYLPKDTTQIISGGAIGIDSCAKAYALSNGIQYVEFLPDYKRYGKSAPLKRNHSIVENADLVLAFWDGLSPGTKYTIHLCRQNGIPPPHLYAQCQSPPRWHPRAKPRAHFRIKEKAPCVCKVLFFGAGNRT